MMENIPTRFAAVKTEEHQGEMVMVFPDRETILEAMESLPFTTPGGATLTSIRPIDDDEAIEISAL